LFKAINRLENNLVKIIFIGDPAQLAPVNENTSCIFNTSDTQFKNNKLTQYFNDIERNTYHVSHFISSVLAFDKIVLDEIVRSNNPNIKGLSNECRKWVLGTISLPKLKIYKCDVLKFYKYDSNIKKTN